MSVKALNAVTPATGNKKTKSAAPVQSNTLFKFFGAKTQSSKELTLNNNITPVNSKKDDEDDIAAKKRKEEENTHTPDESTDRLVSSNNSNREEHSSIKTSSANLVSPFAASSVSSKEGIAAVTPTMSVVTASSTSTAAIAEVSSSSSSVDASPCTIAAVTTKTTATATVTAKTDAVTSQAKPKTATKGLPPKAKLQQSNSAAEQQPKKETAAAAARKRKLAESVTRSPTVTASTYEESGAKEEDCGSSEQVENGTTAEAADIVTSTEQTDVSRDQENGDTSRVDSAANVSLDYFVEDALEITAADSHDENHLSIEAAKRTGTVASVAASTTTPAPKRARKSTKKTATVSEPSVSSSSATETAASSANAASATGTASPKAKTPTAEEEISLAPEVVAKISHNADKMNSILAELSGLESLADCNDTDMELDASIDAIVEFIKQSSAHTQISQAKEENEEKETATESTVAGTSSSSSSSSSSVDTEEEKVHRLVRTVIARKVQGSTMALAPLVQEVSDALSSIVQRCKLAMPLILSLNSTIVDEDKIIAPTATTPATENAESSANSSSSSADANNNNDDDDNNDGESCRHSGNNEFLKVHQRVLDHIARVMLTELTITAEINAVASRKAYGERAKGSILFDNTDIIAIWRWEAIIPTAYLPASQQAIVREVRAARTRAGKAVQALCRVNDFLSKPLPPSATGHSDISAKLAPLEEKAVKCIADLEKAKEKRRELETKRAAEAEEKIRKEDLRLLKLREKQEEQARKAEAASKEKEEKALKAAAEKAAKEAAALAAAAPAVKTLNSFFKVKPSAPPAGTVGACASSSAATASLLRGMAPAVSAAAASVAVDNAEVAAFLSSGNSFSSEADKTHLHQQLLAQKRQRFDEMFNSGVTGALASPNCKSSRFSSSAARALMMLRKQARDAVSQRDKRYKKRKGTITIQAMVSTVAEGCHNAFSAAASNAYSELRDVKLSGHLRTLSFKNDDRDGPRPAYVGTFSKKSRFINGRRPFARDDSLDYEVESDWEWEEEADGESIGSNDEDDEDEGDNELEYNDFFKRDGDFGSDIDSDGEELNNPAGIGGGGGAASGGAASGGAGFFTHMDRPEQNGPRFVSLRTGATEEGVVSTAYQLVYSTTTSSAVEETPAAATSSSSSGSSLNSPGAGAVGSRLARHFELTLCSAADEDTNKLSKYKAVVFNPRAATITNTNSTAPILEDEQIAKAAAVVAAVPTWWPHLYYHGNAPVVSSKAELAAAAAAAANGDGERNADAEGGNGGSSRGFDESKDAELIMLVHGKKDGIEKLVLSFHETYPQLSKNSIMKRIKVLCDKKRGEMTVTTIGSSSSSSSPAATTPTPATDDSTGDAPATVTGEPADEMSATATATATDMPATTPAKPVTKIKHFGQMRWVARKEFVEKAGISKTELPACEFTPVKVKVSAVEKASEKKQAAAAPVSSSSAAAGSVGGALVAGAKGSNTEKMAATLSKAAAAAAAVVAKLQNKKQKAKITPVLVSALSGADKSSMTISNKKRNEVVTSSSFSSSSYSSSCSSVTSPSAITALAALSPVPSNKGKQRVAEHSSSSTAFFSPSSKPSSSSGNSSSSSSSSVVGSATKRKQQATLESLFASSKKKTKQQKDSEEQNLASSIMATASTAAAAAAEERHHQ